MLLKLRILMMGTMMVRIIVCENKCQMLFISQEYVYTHVTFIRISFSFSHPIVRF